jgi:hypothetical protein
LPNYSPKIYEAIEILSSLGLPDKQLNERTALCFLALLNLKEDTDWSLCQSWPLGITPIMNYIATNYGKIYKPNTRETIRDESVTPLVLAGILVKNLDDPYRAKNSSLNNYQIEAAMLELIKTFNTDDWGKNLKTYLEGHETLKKKYAKEREMVLVPISTGNGAEIKISPGDHSLLIKSIIEDFAPRFAPGSELLYVGDTGSKWSVYSKESFEELGLIITETTNMPDVILLFKEKGWLLLIESVTSNGPMNAQRHEELKKLFSTSKAPIVYVTAFPSRKAMTSFLSEIAWQTEVWCSDSPTHLIHFNGSRFLGPY